MKKPYELEQAYNAFRASHTEAQSQAFVEYLGVNFSQQRSAPPVFKAYYTTAKSMQQLPAVLQPLVDRDMIHALNRIDDTVNRGCIRYEIGLKNRTNANMAFLDRWIGQLFPEIERHRDEINRLYSIRCVKDERYRQAALYFLGLILETGSPGSPQTKAVKLHYLLRKCSDPDRIGRSYTVDNPHFLGVLAGLEIPELCRLCDLTGALVEAAGGELWMAAVDYYRNGLNKYKIYIKKFSDTIYERMIARFQALGCGHLAEQIAAYRDWVFLHPELERYGIAFCLDTQGIWSVNFYH